MIAKYQLKCDDQRKDEIEIETVSKQDHCASSSTPFYPFCNDYSADALSLFPVGSLFSPSTTCCAKLWPQCFCFTSRAVSLLLFRFFGWPFHHSTSTGVWGDSETNLWKSAERRRRDELEDKTNRKDMERLWSIIVNNYRLSSSSIYLHLWSHLP